MAFFKVDTSEDNIRDYNGDGAWINKSGIYEVIIKSVIVETSNNGSQFINLWLSHEGQEQPIFQAMRLTNNDGTPNLGQKLFNKFCVVAGAPDGGEISDPVERMVPIGKGGEEKECLVLEDFDDIPMFIRVQMEYSIYNGEIQQTKSIRNFFRYEDKATASEIINDSEDGYKGKQFDKETEYADKVTYRDGLTKEDIDDWLKEQKSYKKTDKDKKPSNGFGSSKKPMFAKKEK